MTAFVAEYHGTCEECTGPIVPGQEVSYDATDDLVHVECPDPLSAGGALRPGEVVCPDCFLIHAGGCF